MGTFQQGTSTQTPPPISSPPNSLRSHRRRIASRASQVALAAFGFSALVGLTYGALYAWTDDESDPRPAPDARGVRRFPIRRSPPLWRWLKVEESERIQHWGRLWQIDMVYNQSYASTPSVLFDRHQREAAYAISSRGLFPAVDHVQVSVQRHAVRRHALLDAWYQRRPTPRPSSLFPSPTSPWPPPQPCPSRASATSPGASTAAGLPAAFSQRDRVALEPGVPL